MGGRIAEQVRQALILAAKTAAVAGAVVGAGCSSVESANRPVRAVCPISPEAAAASSCGSYAYQEGTLVEFDGGLPEAGVTLCSEPGDHGGICLPQSECRALCKPPPLSDPNRKAVEQGQLSCVRFPCLSGGGPHYYRIIGCYWLCA